MDDKKAQKEIKVSYQMVSDDPEVIYQKIEEAFDALFEIVYKNYWLDIQNYGTTKQRRDLGEEAE
jgi:hypothetical protein